MPKWCIRPSDCVSEVRTSSPTQGGRRGISIGCLQDRLEKGVILRARVLGVLVDRDDDQRQAAALARRFLANESPLTT